MSHVTPKRRVEQALPMMLLHAWLYDMVQAEALSGRQIPTETAEVLQTLTKACHVPIEGLNDKDKAKTVRRIERLSHSIMSEFNGHTAGKVWLAIIYLWHDLIEDGFCTLVADSDADKAFEAIKTTVIKNGEKDLPLMEKSAEKAVARIRKRLEIEGYYQKVDIENGGK